MWYRAKLEHPSSVAFGDTFSQNKEKGEFGSGLTANRRHRRSAEA